MNKRILDDDGNDDVDGGGDDHDNNGGDDDDIYNMVKLMTISDSFQFEHRQ